MLRDGDQDTGSLAFAYHARDVISGDELLSIYCFVEVRFWSSLSESGDTIHLALPDVLPEPRQMDNAKWNTKRC
jgi:hypothetical protein